ncbi:MAG: ABC transporter substrate-binding protein [Chloroflexota bacterium]|nr:ABC transporter substrate-binding protein [Chloroflexota bacterium]MDE2840737.1 ABC transporter substrate-binding protein [Chloroflexota bacterium]MDE2931785.1 ABC transporter substrate-binding protein [Chloroflexota bacterium]
MSIQRRLRALAAAIVAVIIVVGCAQVAPVETKETIVFNDLNWASAQVQNRIAQYIVEKGYGYPTRAVAGPTLPLFESLRRGDSHVTMEIWLPNQRAVWEEALAAGQVVAVGESVSGIAQSSFMIPAYIQESHPELDSVADLKEEQYRKLFATAESGGKARLVACPSGWACEAVNATKVESYGLSDHVHVVVPESEAALNDEVFALYAAGEPWLGYLSGDMPAALKLDMVPLAEPAYSDECWSTTKACTYEAVTALIAVRPELLTDAPEVVALLRKWDFTLERYKELAVWRLDNEAGIAEAALWWLNHNADVWSQWVTPEAAAAVQAALDAGETAAGWPTE